MSGVADVLRAAADLIEPEGAWIKHSFCNGGFCILGALAHVSGIDPSMAWTGHIASDARGPISDTIGVPTYEITDWNDAPERTQAEVVAALRAAATLAESAR